MIGLTGEPESLRKYGELVCMTAEMMLEQSRLMHLAQTAVCAKSW